MAALPAIVGVGLKIGANDAAARPVGCASATATDAGTTVARLARPAGLPTLAAIGSIGLRVDAGACAAGLSGTTCANGAASAHATDARSPGRAGNAGHSTRSALLIARPALADPTRAAPRAERTIARTGAAPAGFIGGAHLAACATVRTVSLQVETLLAALCGGGLALLLLLLFRVYLVTWPIATMIVAAMMVTPPVAPLASAGLLVGEQRRRQSPQQTRQGTAPGDEIGDAASEVIEARGIHRMVLQTPDSQARSRLIALKAIGFSGGQVS